ncbi:hypothetical protein B484DRAFT_422050, partial [Ochromonadaceae sp. CCMP2298]
GRGGGDPCQDLLHGIPAGLRRRRRHRHVENCRIRVRGRHALSLALSRSCDEIEIRYVVYSL